MKATRFDSARERRGRQTLPLVGLLMALAMTAGRSSPALAFADAESADSAFYPSLSVFPYSVDFGYVEVGQTGWRDVTIRNNGTEPIENLSVWDSSDTSIWVRGFCPFRLEPGRSCHYSVEFRPNREGTAMGWLHINYRGGATSVSISGWGRERR